MDELKEIERKLNTVMQMSDIREAFKIMEDKSHYTQEQCIALEIVNKRQHVEGVSRASDLLPIDAGKYAGDTNAIMAKTDNGYFFAGMADEIVRGGK